MIDINFRRLTINYTDCVTLFGRFCILKTYQKKAYEQLVDTVQIEKKIKIKPIKVDTFIQTDKLRDSYDSYKRLKSAYNKKYMSRVELAQLNNK